MDTPTPTQPPVPDPAPVQPSVPDPAPAQTPDPAPAQTPAPAPAQTPATTETAASDNDQAPDSNDPGDSQLPEELAEYVHEGDVPQDNVDQEG